MSIKKITEIIDCPKRDCIYDVIAYLNLKLCVDVGAAAGHVTRKFSKVGGEHTKVVAFEPFPGNHRYFINHTNDLNNQVRLVKKAVSDHFGEARFTVPSCVCGNETGWEKYAGYSSVGYLSPFSWRSKIKNKDSIVLKVETTTIDREFKDQTIDFMKIDVQGGEQKVLLGANSMLRQNKILILYIEWSGERQVVETLAKDGYVLYDSVYVACPKVSDVKAFEDIGFSYIDEINLSTGKIAYEMILADTNVSPIEAIKEVRKRRLGWIQTDLIAVSKDVKNEFLMASKQFAAQHVT